MTWFMNNEAKKAFYKRCGEIIGIPHEWTEPVARRTRWNTRFLGNGRFPGFGVIRTFGSSFHVMSKAHGSHYFTSEEAVYAFLSEKMALRT